MNCCSTHVTLKTVAGLRTDYKISYTRQSLLSRARGDVKWLMKTNIVWMQMFISGVGLLNTLKYILRCCVYCIHILILMIVYYVIILILTQITRINIMYYTVNDKILIRLNPLFSCCSNVARCDFLNVFFCIFRFHKESSAELEKLEKIILHAHIWIFAYFNILMNPT